MTYFATIGPYAQRVGGPLSYYVDGTSGNDSGQGTQTDPLRTITEAFRRIPLVIDFDVQVIVLTAGTYVCPPFLPRIWAGGQVYVRAIPVTQVLGSTVALAGTSGSSIKATGLVADQYIDTFLRILAGNAAGQRRLIKTNTATDITPVRDFNPAAAQNDTYDIVSPVCVLQGGTGTAIPTLHGTQVPISSLLVGYEPSLNFENFVIDRTIFITGRVAFWQCTTTSVGILLWRSGNALLGTDSAVSRGAVGPSRIYGGSEQAWIGNGLVHQFSQEPDAGGFYGYVNATHGLFIRSAPYTQIEGGNIRGDHTTVDGAGVCALFGGDSLAQVRVIDGPLQNSGAFRVRNGAQCVLSRISITGQVGNTGAAVTVGAYLDIQTLGANIQIVGGTYGLQVRNASKAFTHEAAPSITGGTANLAAGETPATAASVPTVGAVLLSPNNDGALITRVE